MDVSMHSSIFSGWTPVSLRWQVIMKNFESYRAAEDSCHSFGNIIMACPVKSISSDFVVLIVMIELHTYMFVAWSGGRHQTRLPV